MTTPEIGSSSTRALRGASLLILLQIISRAITFVANQVLVRFLTAQLLGVSTQLEVYYLSVIFFARESLRVAIQRQDSSVVSSSSSSSPKGSKADGKANASAQAVINLGYLSILLGIPLALFFGWLYLNSLSSSTLESAPNLIISLYIYALAAVLELVSEPAFVVMQTRLQFGTRAAAESVATFLRCVITLGSAIWGADRDLGVLPFALGQLSYGVGLLGVYIWHGAGLARRERFSLLPRRIVSTATHKPKPPRSTGRPQFVLSYFYRPTLQLASSMMAQSVVKHVLTQGDTFLVSILSTPAAQGVYALANNYGGLLARLVFQPIEESSRSYFSRLLTPSTSGPGEPGSSATHQAASALQSLLKSYSLLSLVITTLLPPTAPLLLALVAGPRWSGSGAGACLAAYAWYIPLLAFNGVTEAFVASVATEAEVHRQSAWMAVFSVVFAVNGFLLLRALDMGAVGLVVANSINMVCRIAWCAVYIRVYFRRTGAQLDVLGMLPNPVAVLAGVVTSQLVKRAVSGSAEGEPQNAREVTVDLAKAAAVALPFVIVVAVSERKFLFDAFHNLKGRRQTSP
ncbi:Oligosaccharide translocation protein RFT1 [Madurella mycetomatis]|uniref:Man(5)GlcNAc(2)-PP-dolichol translocation protein RFT1 n=1 Tax=Madurella mycetomatis TaxID=100816 RepID=A0A175WD48_9PEZI|nr:Oligosaccharide translocation protein RFT1 [Madurella mycetomatis]